MCLSLLLWQARNHLGLSKISRVQRINMEGGEAVAFMGTGGKTVCLAVKELAAGAVSVVDNSFLSCSHVTSACGFRVKEGGVELLFAECDASGERGWLVLRTGAIDKPLHQVRFCVASPACTAAFCAFQSAAARGTRHAKHHVLQARFSRRVVGLFVCEQGVRPSSTLRVIHNTIHTLKLSACGGMRVG